MHCAACTPNTYHGTNSYRLYHLQITTPVVSTAGTAVYAAVLQCCSVGPIFKVIFNICGVVVCVSA